MSRAMATSDQIDYISLARNGESLDRSLSIKRLSRLDKLVSSSNDVTISLDFFEDAESRPWVRGQVQVLANLPCNRCPESVSREIFADISVCLVASEVEAKRLAGDHDVLIVLKEGLSIVTLIEDDLLLSLPSRACEKAHCKFDRLQQAQATLNPVDGNRENISRESVEVGTDESLAAQNRAEQDRQRPFESLRELMSEKRENSGKSSKDEPDK